MNWVKTNCSRSPLSDRHLTSHQQPQSPAITTELVAEWSLMGDVCLVAWYAPPPVPRHTQDGDILLLLLRPGSVLVNKLWWGPAGLFDVPLEGTECRAVRPPGLCICVCVLHLGDAVSVLSGSEVQLRGGPLAALGAKLTPKISYFDSDNKLWDFIC